MKSGLGVSRFPKVGREGYGGRPMRTSTTSCCWGVLGRGNTWDGTSKLRMEGTEEGSKWSMGRALGCPCFPRMKWRKVKTSHEKRFGRFIIRKSGGGKALEAIRCAPQQLFFCCGVLGRRIYHMRLDFQGGKLAGTEEGSKCSMGRGLGSQAWGKGLGWFRKGQIKPWKKGLVASWFPRVGWEGFGGGSMRTSTTTSCCWGVLWIGIYHMRWDFQDGKWQVLRKPQNEAWGGGWAAHPNNGWKGFKLV